MKTQFLTAFILIASLILPSLGPTPAIPAPAQEVSAEPEPLEPAAIAGDSRPESLSPNMEPPPDLETDEVDPETRVRVEESFGNLPLYFVENQGQMDEEVAYYIQGHDKTIYFTGDGVTFVLTEPITTTTSEEDEEHILGRSFGDEPESNDIAGVRRWAVKLDFVGANPVQPAGQERTEAVISYFKGSPDQWHAGLPTYSSIIYHNLWPGIDLVYYGTTTRLKHEFIVQPGADPAQIQLAYRGASGVDLDPAGGLEVSTPLGNLDDAAPLAYQDINGQRVDVSVSYELPPAASHSPSDNPDSIPYTFSLGDYDPTRPLMLDPEMIVYCGYIGGGNSDKGFDIAVDEAGNAYIVGETESTEANLPVNIGPDLTYNGEDDVFIAKVSASGSALEYCGYIGGEDNDLGRGIAVDEAGNAYVIGGTRSTEATFPVIIGPDLSFNSLYEGYIFGRDAFVARVNASGTNLDYCGYIGGMYDDWGRGIAVDSIGNAYVVGETKSTENTFPVTIGPDLVYNGGASDIFVARVNASGANLDYCGYIGGDNDDYGLGIALDGTGNAYVVGKTVSTETTFPVAVGPDLTHNGGHYYGTDAFVARVNASGVKLDYCGYIGGNYDDTGYDIAVDETGNAYVVGYTVSTETTFPVAVGPDLTINGNFDAFVAKVSESGTNLDYCGYIGGNDGDYGLGIAVDASGNAYLVGQTESTESTFPVTNGPDMTENGNDDTFVARVSASGASLDYCGYIGGEWGDYGYGIAVDEKGNAYVVGYTGSTEATFPISVGPDMTYNGDYWDAFVAKVSAVDEPEPDGSLALSVPGGYWPPH
ncbi:MAG: SBBP repeat-containing protein, partial [Anaerolineales bacterium]|nr:SBBP repeat-containing protein [Anaerolineales bacterium]